ncbi:RISC-loading complex subunit tarbp2 isoform X2 [Nerophis ophidion]|uniref:RISC-loading complex subunit tarbp2 isoform X2 n=1 Tax=Nerophis ophidion TaxID=159077 RepID=UPI002ADFA6D6|nr:RISC-loading complex subunit tarbp2 isoform X2 [Nerophis ophidion]
MSPRKCFFGCEGKVNLFAFPKVEGIKKKWLTLLFPEQQKKNSSAFVCLRHFTRDCFVNMGQFEAGLAGKLLLKDDAFPTILGRMEESEEKATTSQILTCPQHRHTRCPKKFASTESRGTQFSPHMVSVGTYMWLCPSKRSMATQLSYSTLQRVRSKGTQVTISDLSVGTSTKQLDTAPRFFPTPGVPPVKRPHIKLEESEDEDQDNEETLLPHALKYESGDSITESSEISGEESNMEHNDRKYLVFESCLMDLFQTCPVCNRDCQVQSQRLGTYVAFTQLCLHCQYTRKWQSQPLRGSTPVENLQLSAAFNSADGSCNRMDKIVKTEFPDVIT